MLIYKEINNELTEGHIKRPYFKVNAKPFSYFLIENAFW